MLKKICSKDLISEFSKNASNLVGVQLTICLPLIICLLYIGRLGDPISLGAFGIASTIMNMIFNAVILGIQETFGVKASKFFATKNFVDFNKIFWKTVFLTTILIFLFAILAVYSTDLLIFINIQPQIAIPAGELLIKSIPFLIFLGFNQVLQNCISVQKKENYLFIMNITSIFLVLIIAPIFIIKLNYREIGFAYTKLIQESINFIYFIIIIYKKCDHRAISIPTLKIFSNFKNYIKELSITILSFYGECIAYEVNTYFAAILNDIDQLATWVTLMNYGVIIYFSSIGLSFTVRNMISHRLHEKKKNVREDFMVFVFYIFVIALVVIIFQIVFRDNLASFFTSYKKIHPLFEKIMFIYVLNVFPTLVLYTLNTVLRVIDQNCFQFFINTFFLPIIIVFTSYFFCIYQNMGVIGLFWSCGICKSLTVVILIIALFFKFSWDVKNKEFYDEEEIQHLIEENYPEKNN